ncbi:unnamed protein product [Microthlaspi erraticum]|uniref:Arabidopsis retrotransposon Orf1 C-terminal domain-containing protein n=1 Tax=Microthlaspi erraticum TaxID=1685480 RepID=A0A6D2JUJ0_9BRAS|nr:unnamed protein product [Microthlaspi erraticum]
MDIKFCKTNLLIEHKELDGRFQFKFTHPLAGPSKLLLPNPELTTVVRGENIDFRPPVYTLVGHETICEKRSLSSIELRIELSLKLRIESRRVRIWGKPLKDAKVHGQDGEQDQEFGEEGFWFFKQEEEGSMSHIP